MEKNSLIACLFFAYLVLEIANPSWASSSDSKTFSFPEVTGWKQTGEIQTFIPKNLYEYINGAADLYLSYDFEELKVAEYRNNKKANITVEVYRHRTPTHAFGIYSQERLPVADSLEIGAQGYRDNEILNFVTGPYYVKMNSFQINPEEQEVLNSFAKKVAENLGEKGALPSTLATFPAEGKIDHSEKFVAIKFLGYSFLHSAFTADYELSGKKFRVFVIEGEDKNECGNMIQSYLQQTRNPETRAAEGRYTLVDPHHGGIDLYWKGKQVWGILGLDDPALRSKYLKLVEEAAEK